MNSKEFFDRYIRGKSIIKPLDVLAAYEKVKFNDVSEFFDIIFTLNNGGAATVKYVLGRANMERKDVEEIDGIYGDGVHFIKNNLDCVSISSFSDSPDVTAVSYFTLCANENHTLFFADCYARSIYIKMR